MSEINPAARTGLANVVVRSSALAWWSALTILVSAFLLFQVQPVISKKILPWFGGSPAVWTTAMLFFQVVLLAGYAYAHFLIRFVPRTRQGLVHGILLVLSLLSLPIIPGEFWKPDDGRYPAMRILALLLAKVGPTYFLLSATGPLVQAWFSQAYPGRSPYRLYALSNVGSLAALLSYPFVFEIMLTVNNQGWLWSFGFVFFAALIGFLAYSMWKLSKEPILARQADAAPETAPTQVPPGVVTAPTASPSSDAASDAPPSFWLRAAWVSLAALGSMALLAVTNHVCQDIAVVPFMWVAPLSLYLLSFIICFDSPRWYIRKLWAPLLIFGIVALTALKEGDEVRSRLEEWSHPAVKPVGQENAPQGMLGKMKTVLRDEVLPIFAKPAKWVWDNTVTQQIMNWYDDNLIAQAIAYITVLFLICMVAHGELVNYKPQPQYLTMYFLMISAGGALGGLFVALICPMVFKTYFELPLAILCGFVVGWVALANDGRDRWLKGQEVVQWVGAFVIVIGVLLMAKGHIDGIDPGTVVQRNFYGTLSVSFDDVGRSLHHGRILHGFQYREPIEVGDLVYYQPPGGTKEQFEVLQIGEDETQSNETPQLGEYQANLGKDGQVIHAKVDIYDLEEVKPRIHPRELEPTTYYVNTSGAGLAAEQYPRLEGQGMRVAVIGLGTGSMAAHGQKGDVYRFYEIDPKVVAMSDKYFTYRSKGAAKSEVVLGDARIRMEREEPQNYDLIVLDAFSGDAIPAHLLTVEAIRVYERHLRKDSLGQPIGLIVVHISNRYLDLEPVVAALSREFKYPAKMFHASEDEEDTGYTSSDWIIMTRNKEFWQNPHVEMLAEDLNPVLEKGLLWRIQRTYSRILGMEVSDSNEVLWTDQRSSLLPILK